MKGRKSVLISGILVLLLAVSGCAPQNGAGQVREDAVLSSERMEESQPASESGPAEHPADIRYPELVSDALAADPFYQEAAKDEHAVILVDGNVVTSEKPVTDFFEQYQSGESCELGIYYFYDQDDPWKRLIQYDSAENALYEIYQDAVKGADGPQWDGGAERFPIVELSLTEFGFLCVMRESDGIPDYRQVISNYDLFEDYDRMVELAQRYVTPIYMCTIWDNTFSTPSEITCWMEILSAIVGMECAEDESFWTVYPEGKLSVDDMMRHLNQYFEVDKETVLSRIRSYMLDETTVQYEGGLGGAYPQALVYELLENGDTSTILCRHRSAISGEVDMEHRYLITVKNMPDGSFRYLSMEEYFAGEDEHSDAEI